MYKVSKLANLSVLLQKKGWLSVNKSPNEVELNVSPFHSVN